MRSGKRSIPPTGKLVVGLIADTHGLIRPEVAPALAGVDLIIHAGDVGGRAVLDALSKIAPVEAVYGNVDDPRDPALARERVLTLGGVTVHVSHGHELERLTPERLLMRYSGDVLIFGHTHRALIVRDVDLASTARLVVNPGAAGPRRFDLAPSVARLTIVNGRPDVEIISLA